jgi:large subunit ribosomal protein L10
MAAEWKKRLIKQYQKLMKEYSVIGVVNLHAMPTAQLQQMKIKLKESCVIIGGRKRLFARAIELAEKEKPGLKDIEKNLEEGLPALMFTNENPFLLYKKLSQSKISAPAKAGDISPKELVISAGPTPFAPGPIIGELGRLGIKTGVEGGKVAVKQDSVVAKKGDKISAELSSILLRLGIEPMEIGLDLVAAYENGIVFGKDVLEIDEAEFMGRLETAAKHAFNLSVNATIFTKDTTEIMVAKAFNDAKALAREQNILADAVAEELVAKASIQMTALKNELKIEEKLAETQKEEPKAEPAKEKAEEAPKQEEKTEAKEEPKAEEKTEEKKEKTKPEAEK